MYERSTPRTAPQGLPLRRDRAQGVLVDHVGCRHRPRRRVGRRHRRSVANRTLARLHGRRRGGRDHRVLDGHRHRLSLIGAARSQMAGHRRPLRVDTHRQPHRTPADHPHRRARSHLRNGQGTAERQPRATTRLRHPIPDPAGARRLLPRFQPAQLLGASARRAGTQRRHRAVRQPPIRRIGTGQRPGTGRTHPRHRGRNRVRQSQRHRPLQGRAGPPVRDRTVRHRTIGRLANHRQHPTSRLRVRRLSVGAHPRGRPAAGRLGL